MVPVKMLTLWFVLISCYQVILCQRSPYAGSRPTGYKDRFVPKRNENANANSIGNDLDNRFGGNIGGTQRPPVPGVNVVYGEPGPIISNRFPEGPLNSVPVAPTTVRPEITRLPYDAHGDAQLVYYLLSLPIEQRPFWLLNYQLIEAHRNSITQGNLNSIPSRPFFAG